MSVFVIAEAGSCHDGSLEKAKRLVIAAQHAGADAVKFQLWTDAAKLADRRRAPEYAAVYFRYQLPLAWIPILHSNCEQLGLEFMATTYLREDVSLIAPWVKRFKIASFEAADPIFIAAHAPFARAKSHRLLISCGMSDRADWDLVSMALYGHAAAIPQWVPGVDFLHCVSAYPTPVEQLNLAVLRETDDHCAIWSGLSDHTTHPLVGALAVAAGARIIEAHLKLDDTDPQNPDAPHARTPTAFADYVRNIRFAKAVMGDGVKRVMPSEAAMLPYRVQP